MTAILEAPLEMQVGSEPAQESVVLYNIDWDFYDALLIQLNNRRLFVTYDEGTMEIMSPSFKHDNGGRVLSLFVTVLAEQLHTSIKGIKSTTLQRKDLGKGLEADEAFYITNWAKVAGIDNLDLSKLPPPDLVIEVEISARLGVRQRIYAAMGVPELWRYDGKKLIVEILGSEKIYTPSDVSVAFPSLPVDQVARLVEQASLLDDIEWMQLARQWIRDHVISK